MTQHRNPPNDSIPDLDIDAPAPKLLRREPVQVRPTSEPPEFELEAVTQSVAVLDAGDKTERWPTAATPAPSQIVLEPEQLTRRSDYGEPPQHLFETPAYAWLVYRIQRQLKHQVEAANRQLEQIELQRDRVLAGWVDGLRAQLVSDERFARMLQPIISDESNFQAGQGDYARQLAEATSERQATESARALMQQRIAEANDRVRTQAERVEEGERAFAREQAKRKRIDIEMRAAGPIAAAAPDWFQRIADADAASHAAHLKLEELRQGLSEVTRTKDATELELRHIEDRARQALRAQERRAADAERQLSTSEQSLVKHKVAIGRALLALRDRRYYDASTMEALLQKDAEVNQSATELEYLVRALSGFDRLAVKRGLRLSLATLGFGTLLVIVEILL